MLHEKRENCELRIDFTVLSPIVHHGEKTKCLSVATQPNADSDGTLLPLPPAGITLEVNVKEKKHSKFAVISFIASLVSALCASLIIIMGIWSNSGVPQSMGAAMCLIAIFGIFNIIFIVAAIVSIIFGIIGLRQRNTTKTILAEIGIVISILIICVCIYLYATRIVV